MAPMAGRVMARALVFFPLLDSVSPYEQDLLAEAGVSAEALLGERALLCACAIEAALSEALPDDVATSVRASFRATLMSEKPGLRAILTDDGLDTLVGYYVEAVDEDTSLGKTSLDGLSELECAFGDRLLALGEDNELRGRACVQLSTAIPKVLWSSSAAAARNILCDANLLVQPH